MTHKRPVKDEYLSSGIVQKIASIRHEKLLVDKLTHRIRQVFFGRYHIKTIAMQIGNRIR